MKGGKLTTGMRLGIARKGLGKFVKANALTAILFTGMDYAERKAMGQTDTQAAAGSIASTAGGLGATFLALALFPEPFRTGIGLIGLGILGIAASMGAGWAADSITGANNAQQQGGEEAVDPFPWMNFHKGGIVPMDMTAALKGGEIVIDTNSVGPA